MKKVVERLNRVLAIVLAIAMVATCIPQTALTVYASETEQSTESTTESEEKDAPDEEPAPAPPEEKVEAPAEEPGDNDAPPEEPSKTEEPSKPEETSSASESSSASEPSKPEETSKTEETSKVEESLKTENTESSDESTETENTESTEEDIETEVGDDGLLTANEVVFANNDNYTIGLVTADSELQTGTINDFADSTYFYVKLKTEVTDKKISTAAGAVKYTVSSVGGEKTATPVENVTLKAGGNLYRAEAQITKPSNGTDTTITVTATLIPVSFAVEKEITKKTGSTTDDSAAITFLKNADGDTAVSVVNDKVTTKNDEAKAAANIKFKVTPEIGYMIATGAAGEAANTWGVSYKIKNAQADYSDVTAVRLDAQVTSGDQYYSIPAANIGNDVQIIVNTLPVGVTPSFGAIGADKEIAAVKYALADSTTFPTNAVDAKDATSGTSIPLAGKRYVNFKVTVTDARYRVTASRGSGGSIAVTPENPADDTKDYYISVDMQDAKANETITIGTETRYYKPTIKFSKDGKQLNVVTGVAVSVVTGAAATAGGTTTYRTDKDDKKGEFGFRVTSSDPKYYPTEASWGTGDGKKTADKNGNTFSFMSDKALTGDADVTISIAEKGNVTWIADGLKAKYVLASAISAENPLTYQKLTKTYTKGDALDAGTYLFLFEKPGSKVTVTNSTGVANTTESHEQVTGYTVCKVTVTDGTETTVNVRADDYGVKFIAESDDTVTKTKINDIKYVVVAASAAAPAKAAVQGSKNTWRLGTTSSPISGLKAGDRLYFVVSPKTGVNTDISVYYKMANVETPVYGSDGLYYYTIDSDVPSREIYIKAEDYSQKSITFASGTKDDVDIWYSADKNAADRGWTKLSTAQLAATQPNSTGALKLYANGQPYYLKVVPKGTANANKSVKAVKIATGSGATTTDLATEVVGGKIIYKLTVDKDDTKDEISVDLTKTVAFTFKDVKLGTGVYDDFKKLEYSYMKNGTYYEVPKTGTADAPVYSINAATGQSVYLKVTPTDNTDMTCGSVTIKYGNNETNATKDGQGIYTLVSQDDSVVAYDVRVSAPKIIRTFNFVKTSTAEVVRYATSDAVVVATGSSGTVAVTVLKGEDLKIYVKPASGYAHTKLTASASENGSYTARVGKAETVDGTSRVVYTIKSETDNGKYFKAEGLNNMYTLTIKQASGVSAVVLTGTGNNSIENQSQSLGSDDVTASVLGGNDVRLKVELTSATAAKYTLVGVEAAGHTVAKDSADNTYIIKNVSKNANITIKTELNNTANSFTLKEGTGTSGAVKVTSGDGKTEYGLDQKIYVPGTTFEFKVVLKKGYSLAQADGVTSAAATIASTGESADKTYTATVASSNNARVDADITINAVANAVSGDRYIKLTPWAPGSNKYTISTGAAAKVNNIELVTGKEAQGIYKVPESDKEVKFTVTVPREYKVTMGAGYANTIRQSGEATWKDGKGTYTYILAMGALESNEGTEASPYVITPSVTGRVAKVTVADGSKKFKSVKVDGKPVTFVVASGDSVTVGSTVVVQIGAGQTLKRNDKADGTMDTKTVDADGKYAFTVENEKDIVFSVEGDPLLSNDLTDDYRVVEYTDTDNKKVGSIVLDYMSGEGFTKEKVLGIAKEGALATKAAISGFEIVPLDSKGNLAGTTVAIGGTGDDLNKKLTITADRADKGRKFKVEIYTEVTSDGISREVTAGVVNVEIKSPVAEFKAPKAPRNKTVTVLTGQKADYEYTIKPEKQDNYLYCTAKVMDGNKVTSDDAGVDVAFAGGKMTITAPGYAEKAKITVYGDDATGGAGIYEFIVNTVTASPKLAKVESPAQSFNSIFITLTADAGLNKQSYDNLYYEVNVEPETPKNVKYARPSGSIDGEKVYYFKKADGVGAITKEIRVNSDSIPSEKNKWTYKFTSRLVILDSGIDIEDGEQALITGSSIIGASAKTIEKKFDTRDDYYEDKLGVTRKTTKLLSGQSNVLVGVVKYSNKASRLSIETGGDDGSDGFGTAYSSSVTDKGAIVLDSNGVAVPDFTVMVNNETNEVKVSAPDTGTKGNVKGRYSVVLYAKAETNMYRAKAEIPITVDYGIERIEADVPTQVAVLSKTRNTTITVKPTGYAYGTGNIKASSKFTYELLTADSYEKDEAENVKKLSDAGNAELRKLTVKNNVVTIPKGFTARSDADDNTFVIRVRAADYIGNDAYKDFKVEITDKPLVLGKVYIADEMGDPIDTAKVKMAKDANWKQIVVLDDKGNVVDGSLYTVKGNANLYPRYNADNKEWRVAVNGKASAQLVATTLDGGKKTAKSVKYTFGYAPATFTIDLVAKNDIDTNVTVTSSNGGYRFAGNGAPKISFRIKADSTYAYKEFYNYDVKASKGSKVTVNGYNVVFYPDPSLATEQKVIITDKAKRAPNTTEFTFTNSTPVATPAKAPAVSTRDKYYWNECTSANVELEKTLKYTFTSAVAYKKALVSWESGSKVKLHDGTSYVTSDVIVDIVKVSNSNNKYEFTLKVQNDDPVWTSGTAKFKIVYGSDTNTFTAQTKPGALNIKIEKLADFRPASSYTFTPKVGKTVKLTGTPATVAENVTYVKIENGNNGGKENSFRKYFTLDTSAGTLGLTSEATYALISKAGKAGGIPAADLKGYVTYTYSVGNGTVTKTAPITVKFNLKDKGYAAKKAAVDKAASGTTTAQMEVCEGSKPINVDGAKVFIDSDAISAKWEFNDNGRVLTVSGGDEASKIDLKATNPDVKKQKVTLYIVGKDSQFFNEATDLATAKTYGTKITFEITVKPTPTPVG